MQEQSTRLLRRRAAAAAAAALCAALAASGVFAEESGDTSGSGLSEESQAEARAARVTTEAVRVTASRVESELMDVNMSVSVVTEEDIRRSSARNVGELLEDVPGVRINNDGGQGMKRIKIRGEDAYRTLVMIDGQKVAEHKSMSGSPMLIDPSQIERIEVIKGPASVLYGSDAIGGAVNIITKKGGSKPLEGEVSAGLSTMSQGKSAAASVFGAYEGWKYRLSASVESNGNLETPKGEAPNTYFNAHSASAFVSYDVSPTAQLGGSLSYYDLEFGSGDMSGAYENFAVDVPKWTQTKAAVFGEFRELTDALVRLRADAFWQRGDKDMVNTVGVMPMMTVYPIASNQIDQYGFSLQSDWQIGERHYLVAGYELSYDDLSAESVTKMSMPAMSMTVGDKGYDGWQMSNALYASMQTELPADLMLSYGVRYTWVKSEMDMTDRIGDGRKSYDSVSDGKAVFSAGLLWRGTEHLTLRANYSQGYRFPLLQHLYIDTSMGQGIGTTYANPDLKPETSDNFEVGARWLSERASLDATLFYSQADDYIAALWNAALGGDQYQNIAEATTFGLELSGSLRFAESGFEPYASLTLMRRKFEEKGGFSTYDTATPTASARYGVRWSGERAGLGLRADAYLKTLSATKYEASDGESSYALGGATTFNLTGGISFGPAKQYALDAGFYNITDKAYREQTSIWEPGRYFALKLNAKF